MKEIHASSTTFAANVARFFSDSNRSMMGGWTRQERTAAEEHAAKLDGDERVAAEKEIEERLVRERSQFGADYHADKPA
ncbi:MAG: hypothetical protein WKF74_03005 [Pyrinomonadaceae bacterium]